MTSYCTLKYAAVFLPAVMLAYSLLPRRVRWVVLLGASYAFFWSISGKLLVFLLISTLSIYLIGRWLKTLLAKRDNLLQETGAEKKLIKRRYRRKMRYVLAGGIILNFALLIALKYMTFFGAIAASLLSLIGIQIDPVVMKIGIPIGISFYTLQAASYLFDVYRETIPADKNLARMALFMSFFPQIMEGPICRYSDTAKDLYAGNPIQSDNLYQGVLRILYGFMKKLIIADRIDVLVKTIYDNASSYDGGVIAFVAVMYTLQLYCDFSGTIDIVVGSGRIFGVKMPENFRQPFFSRSASEFWKRWHITLGTWFRDYVFYPISLASPIKRLTKASRKKLGNRFGPLIASSIALFCVWLGNGLWHGAGTQYVFFGLYYFVLIIGGNIIEPFAAQLCSKWGINREKLPYRIFQILRTCLLVFIGELFFRASSFTAGFAMFKQMLTDFSIESFGNGTLLGLGMDRADFIIIAVFVVLIFTLSLISERGINIPQWLVCHKRPLRWAATFSLLFVVLIFGAYGTSYLPVDPIYANF